MTLKIRKRFMTNFSKEIHDEFSYPSLLQDEQGNYHLVYTWLRKRIKHVQFNEAWLTQKLTGGDK